jgi:hypothetical protein
MNMQKTLRHVRLVFMASLAMIIVASSAVIGGGGISGSGSIQRFHSIVLNDVEYFTEKARIFINGIAALESDLVIGQVVEIDGRLVGERANADVVRYRSDIIGPIEQILMEPGESGVARLVVLGQSVKTSIRTNVVNIDLNGLGVGDIIELSGLLGADEVLEASFLRKVARENFHLVGIIDSIGLTSFTINQLVIDINSANLIGFTPSPKLGQRVEVIAGTGSLSATSVLTANSVKLLLPRRLKSGQNVEIEGLVNKVIDEQAFILGDRLVLTHDGTVLQNETPEKRRVGNKLEVEGIADSNGTIVANLLIAKHFKSVKVEGRAELVDLDARTITIAGLIFTVDSSTDFRLSKSSKYALNSLDGVQVGDYMKITGFADGSFVVASRVISKEARKRTRLKAPVSDIDRIAGSLWMRGIEIQVDQTATSYLIDGQKVDQSTFFDAVQVGDFVQAVWRHYTTTSSPPHKLKLKRD